MLNLKPKKRSLNAALVLLLSFINIAPTLAGETVITDPDKFSSWAILGPPGGDVRVVTIDPRDKDHLFISTLDGQVYTSTDAGQT